MYEGGNGGGGGGGGGGICKTLRQCISKLSVASVLSRQVKDTLHLCGFA